MHILVIQGIFTKKTDEIDQYKHIKKIRQTC